MILGIEWYWWLIIVIVFGLSIPLKIRFMKWWAKRTKEKEDCRKDKWGGEV